MKAPSWMSAVPRTLPNRTFDHRASSAENWSVASGFPHVPARWPVTSPVPPRPSGEGLPPVEQVLEEPVDLGEVAGFETEIEVRIPLADADSSRQVHGGLRETQGDSFETDAAVDDGEWTPAPGRQAMASRDERRRGSGSDLDRSASVGALDAGLFRETQSEHHVRRSGEPRARQAKVREEALERDRFSFESDREETRLRHEARDADDSLRVSAGVAAALDVRDELLPPCVDRRDDVVEEEPLRVDPRRDDPSRDPEISSGRDVQARVDGRVAGKTQPGVEDPLDFRDRDPSRSDDGRAGGGSGLDRSGRGQLAERSGERDRFEDDSVTRLHVESRREIRNDRLGVGEVEGHFPRGQRPAVVILPDRRESSGEVLERHVDLRFPPVEIEDTLLDDDFADPQLEAAFTRRAVDA
ncbi:MAG: hypothetical protein DMF54_11270 [Acidobacteria bacterium]|nr:MAG: hypothetical protein DMF54_11270 [Acidobacteriota bacterium]